MDSQRSQINPLQTFIAYGVCGCSIAYLIYLLTANASPTLGEWAGPPHLSSSVLLGLALSTVLSRHITSDSMLGWWTIVTSTVFIVGFEFLQLLTPNRSFQFIDIAEGIAGAAIAAMLAVAVIKVIGRSLYVWIALLVVVFVLIASLKLLYIDETDLEVACAQPITGQPDWGLVTIDTFILDQQDQTSVSTSIGPLCFFNSSSDQQITEFTGSRPHSIVGEDSLALNGSGLVSSELTGLRAALSKSREITFGIRFKAGALEAGRPPRLVASLQSIEAPRALVARLIQNGPNATAVFSFQPWQGSSTVLANRLQSQYHEVVLTYDGAVQTTYFDGKVVGTENTNIEAIDLSGGELILNIGKRVDGRWKPFIGEIDALVIGSKSVSSDEVTAVFDK